jgi:polysaccharide export outer membrane protein
MLGKGFFIQLSFVGALLSCKHAPQAVSSLDLSAAPRGRTFNDWGDYVMDSGDLLQILVQNKNEVSGTYRVSPSGNISVPLVGMLRAKGLTEMQLRESLIIKLRPHLPGPRVGVPVTQTNSYTVYFAGRVQKPGTYRLENKTTLLQGLSLAGGIDLPDASRLILVREGSDGTKKRYEAPFALVRSGQAQLDNFVLERGDLIMIE